MIKLVKLHLLPEDVPSSLSLVLQLSLSVRILPPQEDTFQKADQDKNKVLDSVDPAHTTEPTSEHGIQLEDPRKPSRYPLLRSTLFQILVVGMCSFYSPGISSARMTSDY